MTVPEKQSVIKPFREMSMETMPGGYEIVDFDALASVACPCGQAKRAFLDVPDFPATIHRTEITCEARTHYHNRLTEAYYFLQCDADAGMALDGKVIPVKPGMCILIRPGVRHRAIGHMTVLIVVFPKFDPADEVVVEEQTAASTN